jgi:hypothetical protein
MVSKKANWTTKIPKAARAAIKNPSSFKRHRTKRRGKKQNKEQKNPRDSVFTKNRRQLSAPPKSAVSLFEESVKEKKFFRGVFKGHPPLNRLCMA